MIPLNSIFWLVLGLGTFIPFTLLILINLSIKARAGDNYQLDLVRLGKAYLVALIGLAITLGTILGK